MIADATDACMTAEVEQADGTWKSVPLAELDLSTLKVEIHGTGIVVNPITTQGD